MTDTVISQNTSDLSFWDTLCTSLVSVQALQSRSYLAYPTYGQLVSLLSSILLQFYIVTYRMKAGSGDREETSVAKLRHEKHVSAAVTNQATIEELLEAVFSYRGNRKHQFQQFFYCYFVICCRGNKLIVPWPNKRRLSSRYSSGFQAVRHSMFNISD